MAPSCLLSLSFGVAVVVEKGRQDERERDKKKAATEMP
jgi:hypothetical protein